MSKYLPCLTHDISVKVKKKRCQIKICILLGKKDIKINRKRRALHCKLKHYKDILQR